MTPDMWFLVGVIIAFVSGIIIGWFERKDHEDKIVTDFARWVNTEPGRAFRTGRVQGRMDAIDSVASWVERQERPDEPA